LSKLFFLFLYYKEMGGGLMQLVAYGAQDIYLTGNPQITFFKVIYRRHTNFSIESIEQTFNGEAGFNRKVTCTISRNGDLIHRMYMRVQLPDVVVPAPAGGNLTGFRWLDWIGHVIVKTVEVEIGGQKIDKHYSEWLAIWNELTQTAGHALGYADMVGHTRDLNELTVGKAGNTVVSGKELYIPMQFWFCRNPGLALPLIALQYHEVKLNAEFRDVVDCYWSGTSSDSGATWTYAPNACKPSNFTASLYVDYLYLDTDERRRFAQSSHEYLIEQLQFQGDESIPQNSTSWKSKLNFNHPVKELVWVLQRDAMVSSLDTDSTLLRPGKQWFNWTTTPAGSKAIIAPGSATAPAVYVPSSIAPTGDNLMVTAKLQLNGHDRFSERGARYFNLVQPYQHHENVPPAGIYVYSFGLKPEEHQPSGTCNMSRIDNATLQFSLHGGQGSCRIKVFAVNYNVLRVMSGINYMVQYVKMVMQQFTAVAA
jgi:hypothetical protein